MKSKEIRCLDCQHFAVWDTEPCCMHTLSYLKDPELLRSCANFRKQKKESLRSVHETAWKQHRMDWFLYTNASPMISTLMPKGSVLQDIIDKMASILTDMPSSVTIEKLSNESLDYIAYIATSQHKRDVIVIWINRDMMNSIKGLDDGKERTIEESFDKSVEMFISRCKQL